MKSTIRAQVNCEAVTVLKCSDYLARWVLVTVENIFPTQIESRKTDAYATMSQRYVKPFRNLFEN